MNTLKLYTSLTLLVVCLLVSSFVASAQNIPGYESEPNGTVATANPLSGNPVKIRGYVFPNGDLDYFSFTANAGDRVHAATMTSFSSNGSTDSQLELFASDGTTSIEFDDDSGSFGGLSSAIAGATIPASGTYYLRVKHFSAANQLRPYELYLNVVSGAATAETEPNDATPQVLAANGWMSGSTSSTTDIDLYSISLNAGETVYLSLDNDPERDNVEWNMQLGLGQFGTPPLFLVVNDAGQTGPDAEAMFFTVKDAGTYAILVNLPTGGTTFGTYHLSVAVFPATPGYVNYPASVGLPLAIPTGPGLVTSTLTIPDNKLIKDLKVRLDITHTLMADVDVVLQSPNGNLVKLFDDIGAATQPNLNFALSDFNAIPAGLFTVVSGMGFMPENNSWLNYFRGMNAQGTWTLYVYDDLASNGGTLNGWSLDVLEEPVPTLPPVVFSTDFEADNGGFTSSGAANEWEWGTPAFAPITTANSGVNCWKTDLDNTYNVSANALLESPDIDLTNNAAPIYVSWAMKHQIETATFDYAVITIEEVGGTLMTQTLYQWYGATQTSTVGNPSTTLALSSGWGTFYVDISAFAGKVIRFKVRLVTDTSIVFGGIAVDDVAVYATPAITPCSQTPVTASFTNNTPVPIPTVIAQVSSTITVAGAPSVLTDLNLTTFITHTFCGDIDMTLTSPNGTIVTITTDNGGGNDNVFNGTIWDDDADPGNTAPFAAATNAAFNWVVDNTYTNLVSEPTLVPEEAMAAFIGQDPNGVWTLTLNDDAGADGGSINSWTLDITGVALPYFQDLNNFTNNTPQAIPTGPGVITSTINVAGVGTSLTDINMTTFITHTNCADLDITLTSPAGTVMTLTSDNGGTLDNVFNGTVWDDSADPGGLSSLATPNANSNIVTDRTYTNLVTAPTLVPEEAFGAFYGEDPNGIWTLTVSDDLAANGGSLDSWTLHLYTCSNTPTCLPPTGLVASLVTPTSATIGWNCVGCVGTFILEYGPTGFTPGTGLTAGVGGTVINPATSPQLITGLTASTAYQVYVRQNCSGTITANSAPISFTTLMVNDLCVDAIPITCGTPVSATTVGATIDAVGTCTTTLGTAPGIWYSLPGFNGDVVLSLCGSGYDTKIGVFTGTCGALTCVVGNDDFCGLQSQVSFTASAGNTYYILITGFSTATGTFTLNSTCTTCSTPTGVTVSPVTATTAQVNWTCVGCTGTFIVEYGPAASFTTPGTGAAAGVGGTVVVSAGSPALLVGLTAGTQYRVFVRQDCSGSFSNNTTGVLFSTPPANDNVCSAIPLVLGVNPPYTNVGATTEPGEPVPPSIACNVQNGWCAGQTVSHSVWFTLVGPPSGKVTISSTGYDNQLALYAAASCAAVTSGGTTLLAANDDFNGLAASLNNVCVTPGVTYYVQMDGWNTSTGTATITVTEIPNTPPSIAGCPANIVTCANTATWTPPTASDPDGCGTPTLTGTHTPGSVFPNGITTVTYTATDHAGATAVCTFTVNVAKITVTFNVTNVSCFGGNNGSATALPVGGTGHTYIWSNGATGATASGLTAGAYFVTITNVQGCSLVSLVNITQPPALNCNATSTNVACNGEATGTASATASGGVPAYTYNWSNGATGANITGLVAGTYTVTVTDVNGCVCTKTVTITEPPALQVVSEEIIVDGSGGTFYSVYQIVVAGGNLPYDLSFTVTGGFANYTIIYSLVDTDNNGSADSPGATIDVTYQATAVWTLTLDDALGCGETLVFTNAPGSPILSIASALITADNGTSNGAIALTVVGGTPACPGYSYTWSGPANWLGVPPNSPTISGLPSGWYIVLVTDCSGEETYGWFWVPKESRGRGKLSEGELMTAYPNPVNDFTSIEFSMNETAKTTIVVHSIDGKQIAKLFDDVAEAGELYTLSLDAKHLPNGLYMVTLNGDNGIVQQLKLSVLH